MNCGRTNCRCTHTDGCEKGFIWIRYKEYKTIMVNGVKKHIETEYDGVKFCPVCDPERAHIQSTSKSSEELNERLRGLSKYTKTENYNNQENSKTNIL